MAYRQDQRPIEHMEVVFTGGSHQFGVSLQIILAQPKLRQLKIQQQEFLMNRLRRREGNELKAVATKYGGVYSIVGDVVLEQQGIFADCRADLFQTGNICGMEIGGMFVLDP